MTTDSGLRELVEKWRAEAGEDPCGSRELAYSNGKLDQCADEIESLLTAAGEAQPTAPAGMVLVPGAPSKCKECGGTELSWFAHSHNQSQVVEGRLRSFDVKCTFILGCNECSETLYTASADDIAKLLAAAPAAQVAGPVTVPCPRMESGRLRALWRGIALVKKWRNGTGVHDWSDRMVKEMAEELNTALSSQPGDYDDAAAPAVVVDEATSNEKFEFWYREKYGEGGLETVVNHQGKPQYRYVSTEQALEAWTAALAAALKGKA